MAGANRAVTAMWTVALFFSVLAAAGLVGLDGIVAGHTVGLADGGTIWERGVTLFDTIVQKEVTHFLLGFVVLVAGLLLLILRSTRPIGFLLLYLGLVQSVTTIVADLAKPQFGRVRPFEAVQGGDVWFAAGNSFPSGHTAFYAGLFLPLIVLFPRLAPLFAIPPLFVATARVMEHDHYLSDVSVSLALAAALAAGLAFVAEKGRS